MKGIKSIRLATILIVVLLLMVALPYLLALLLTPSGMVFPGFLVNPLDGFSYLAKMNQGAAGSWLFELPYAAEPGEPALLFVFYLFLGHLAGWLAVPPIAVFHATRLIMAMAMGLAAHRFFSVATGSKVVANWSLAVFLFASGLGWLAAAFGWLTSDLLIPESIPLFAASLNPHFPLTFAALALAAANVLAAEPTKFKAGVNLVLGGLLGAIQPFAVMSMSVILGVWAIWELAHSEGGVGGWRQHKFLAPIAALFAGGLPWLLYDFWLTRTHPVLQAWNLQNQTPSPALPAYLLGFGIPLALALIGLVRWPADHPSAGRLMIAWLVVNALLLYAPFSLQRRFSLGLFLPMAAAAGFGLQVLTDGFLRRKWLPCLLILLALPSNLFVLAAGVGLVAEGSPLLLMTEDERAGYRWIADNLNQEPLILAAPRTGNRLPAYGQVRVLYGHPFETPEAETNRQRAIDLLEGWAEEESRVTAELARLGVEYVVIGPHERSLLEGAAVVSTRPILFSQGEFRLYALPAVRQ